MKMPIEMLLLQYVMCKHITVRVTEVELFKTFSFYLLKYFIFEYLHVLCLKSCDAEYR